jgi:acetylornithine deacetylase/succinyl-diaminopimelate desuccinylase-like protein
MHTARPPLDPAPGRRRLRTGLATLALLGAALIEPAPASAVWPFSSERTTDPRDGHAVAAFLSELIREPTFDPPGNEAAVARLVVRRLASAGIEAEIVETPGDGRAAAWARLPGTGGERPLVLLSHIDVVPAEAGDWQRDPFGGEIADGYVHGRGALDAKGVTAIHVFSLLALARREAPLSRDVILLATPGEETGGQVGAGYLARERTDLLGNAEYLLTEGGSIRPRRRSATGPVAPSMWGVTVTEKSPCWLALSTEGTPGHGSAPRADAAVPRLVAALDRIRRVEAPIRVLPEVEAMFLALAASSPIEDRAGFVSLATALEEESDFRRRFLSHPGYNALVRDTISITVLEGGSKTNVVPATARAHLDARLLPGERCEDFTEAIRDVVADPGVRIETLLAFPSVSSPADTPLFEAIERVARRRDPDAIVVPRMIGGFTDAHWFRQLGIVSYGFVPRWIDMDDAAGVHGVDERVSIENLRAGVEAMVEIVETLDGGGATSGR